MGTLILLLPATLTTLQFSEIVCKCLHLKTLGYNMKMMNNDETETLVEWLFVCCCCSSVFTFNTQYMHHHFGAIVKIKFINFYFMTGLLHLLNR